MATKMRIAIFAFAAVLLATLAPAASAQNRGDVIIQHQGMNDPMTEGWCPVNNFNQSVCTNPPTGAGVIEDGEEAWRMDSISSGDTPGIYFVHYIWRDNPALFTEGWVYEARIKFVENLGHGHIELTARDGESLYSFIFDRLAGPEGLTYYAPPDASVNHIQTRYSFPELGDTPEGFNDYKIAYEPGVGNGVITMSLNGAVLLSGDRFDIYGAYPTEWLAFGDNDSSLGPSLSKSFWASVKLSVVPEPTTLSLLVLGSVALWGPMVFRRCGVRA